MKIAIFGLGYVGCVSAACLAEMGHKVIGVDVNRQKLDMLRRGQSPIVEAGLEELLSDAINTGQLALTTDVAAALGASEISLISVGTPSRSNGSLNTHFLDRVVEQIGGALAQHHAYHVIAIRSTLFPGLLQNRVIPFLEFASRKKAGKDFGVCVNPEFLREGSALQDFQTPPFTLIGEIDQRSGDVLEAVYADLPSPLYRVAPDTAAMVKYVSNSYHALKVTFANEIGTICKALAIDAQKVMEIFCQDKILNISTTYLRPGFAFGGSCLPKDLRALLYEAMHHDVHLPLVSAILPSNDAHIQRTVEQVIALNQKNVVLLGLSFKPGTDDLRESPLVRLAETLIGKGFRLRIYDEDVLLSNVFGRNREYIEQTLPHISELLHTDLREILQEAQIVIVGKKSARFTAIRPQLRPEQAVIDLIGAVDGGLEQKPRNLQ